MKYAKYLALLATLTLLTPFCALARERNQHSVDIHNSVQVGTTQLKPGSYKVEWQEDGPAVNVRFVQGGKTVVTQDDMVMRTTSANKNVLEEIDFGHQKEALVFGQHQSNM